MPDSIQPSAARRFARRLLQPGETRTDCLTPLETRLLQVARTFFPDLLMYTRVPERPVEGQGLDPMTPETVALAARLALAAAVEVEQPLREMRDRLEGGR